MPTTVKAAGTELPKSHLFLSAGPCDCPEPCPEPSQSVPSQCHPVQSLGTAGGTGEGSEQVPAHRGAEGWDGAKPGLL